MTGRATGLPGALAVLALVAVLTTPGAGAHIAEEPIDVEVQVLADEGEDAFYWYDGYDLYNLFVREAYLPALEAEGLMFRYTLYGGFAPQHAAQALHIDIEATTPAGETVLRTTTTDDREWVGDLEVVVLNVTEDAPPFTGVTSRIQAFVAYEKLGVTKGEAVSAITMKSWADGDLLDIAPGGVFLPGSQGNAEAPTESQRLVEELELQGPQGYVGISPAVDGANVTFAVENVLSETGQHVELRPGTAPGWQASVVEPRAVSLDAGDTHTFTLQATASPSATDPLPVAILTDLGGREIVYLGVNGTQLQTASTPEGVDVAPEQPAQESPAPGLLAGLAVLALVATLAHRRR